METKGVGQSSVHWVVMNPNYPSSAWLEKPRSVKKWRGNSSIAETSLKQPAWWTELKTEEWSLRNETRAPVSSYLCVQYISTQNVFASKNSQNSSQQKLTALGGGRGNTCKFNVWNFHSAKLVLHLITMWQSSITCWQYQCYWFK